MSADSFDEAIGFVLAKEGGYVDDPIDPGGATNLGITLRVLSAWRHTNVTPDDVRNLQRSEAELIYRANYWNVLHGDNLPKGIDLMLFDAGVNLGTGRSAKLLQQAVKVPVDGAIGPHTLAAVIQMDLSTLIEDLASTRKAFYESLPTFSHFGRGWLARLEEARQKAQSMVGVAIVTSSAPSAHP